MNSNKKFNVVSILTAILNGIKNNKIEPVSIDKTEGDDGEKLYSLRTAPERPHYNFVNATDKLTSSNGMKRVVWNEDVQVQLDSKNHLVLKYRDSDRLHGYDPSYRDVNANDWVILQPQEINPNGTY